MLRLMRKCHNSVSVVEFHCDNLWFETPYPMTLSFFLRLPIIPEDLRSDLNQTGSKSAQLIQYFYKRTRSIFVVKQRQYSLIVTAVFLYFLVKIIHD
jgi:hypothetical protein